ncbi:MAG: S1C family serine protease [Rhodospirillales bacterium]|nr:S1C family serine protease [Rhodospirillales bacterium]
MTSGPASLFRIWSAAVVCLIAMPACQTTQVGTPETASQIESDTRISKAIYTPFFDQTDHLAELVEAGEFEAAAKLYAEQKSFFAERRDQSREVLKRLADHFNGPANKRLQIAEQILARIDWPALPADWPTVRTAVGLAETAIRTYPELAILGDAEFRSPIFERVSAAKSNLKAAIRAEAPESFRKFNHFGEHDFFETYPVRLSKPDFAQAHFSAIESVIRGAGTEKLKMLSRRFTKNDFGTAVWNSLGDHYVAALMTERSGNGRRSLKSALDAFADARRAGFEPVKISGNQTAFVEITSRSLLKHGQIEFPIAVDLDLPFETAPAELEEALGGRAAGPPGFAIILDVALAKTQRRVTSTKKTPARLLVGHKTEPNPAYEAVEKEVAEARMKVQNRAIRSASANSQYCQGLGCLGKALAQVAAGVSSSAAQEELDDAMRKLGETPPVLEIPVYQDYSYDKATVKSTKLMTVHFYVIDRGNRELFKSTFDMEEERSFEVAYGIRDQDPEKEEHLASTDSEDDVIAWEEASADVALSQLLRHYLDNRGEIRPLPQMADLRREMLRDKNDALARYREQTFEGSTQADPRFDSVVVIYTPGRGVGTGFFVRPDVVMTNHHVVDEAQFVEMKMYGGQETFGKVVARDIRLDLALIKVQARGKPVEFYSENRIELGSTVEVIGHPRKLEYAVTRGIISAVRMMKSPNIDSSKKFLQIQIDAATSPGNSGGPVFLKDKVAGVVSWGRVDPGSENLNFTIHYSEASRFLEETLGLSS